MNDLSSNPQYFRCPITGECAVGSLKVGHSRIPVTVLDASIEGFTLRVKKKYVKRVREGCVWTLLLPHERAVVHPQWMFNGPDGDAKIGIRRLRDVTPQEGVRRSWVAFRGRPQDAESDNSGIALGGMVLLLVALICLPGIGDDLGTAPWIRSVVCDFLRGLGFTVRQFLNS